MSRRDMPPEGADPRIRKKPMTWMGVAVTYAVLLILSAGQAMILARYMGWGEGGQAMPAGYVLGALGYWALVTAAFCLITSSQITRWFRRPLLKLSEALREVAGGDFSVSVEPAHTADKYDYIDVMFEDFNMMAGELAATETMRSDFISGVSHEIKTPLAVIENYAAALIDPGTDIGRRAEYAAAVTGASRRLNSLVTSILKLSKLENQQIVPDPEEFDLCAQLAECALSFAEAAERKGIALRAETDDAAFVRADRGMLEIVWSNLLSNALKFTDTGGTVTLAQTSDESGVRVSVSDTGCGMDETTMRRVFDKFFQGDTSRAQDGNGLGLALASRAAQLSGGQISVSSSPGKGSVFTVTLKSAV